MASRQMAFQVSGYDYLEFLKTMVRLGGAASVKAWIEQISDEQRRRRMQACLLAAVKCNEKGLDPMSVKKIVCWRNEAGQPEQMELEFYKAEAAKG